MSDTRNAAEACKRLVASAAEDAGKEKIGAAAWEATSEDEQRTKCKVHIGRCHQHLRNIILNAMQLKQTEVLKDELSDDLAEFSSFERMSVDCNDLIRAIYKDLHGSGAYVLGQGMRTLCMQDGKFAAGKDLKRAKATKGTHVTNDRVESNFGCVDLLMRMFRNATVENISGVAQQVCGCPVPPSSAPHPIPSQPIRCPFPYCILYCTVPYTTVYS